MSHPVTLVLNSCRNAEKVALNRWSATTYSTGAGQWNLAFYSFSQRSWSTWLEYMCCCFFYYYCYILTSQLNRISAEAASLGPATTLFILTYRKVFCKDETVMFDSAGRQERCSHVNPLETKARLVPASCIRKAWDRLSLCVYSS